MNAGALLIMAGMCSLSAAIGWPQIGSMPATEAIAHVLQVWLQSQMQLILPVHRFS